MDGDEKMLELNQVRKEYRDVLQTITAVAVDHLMIQTGEQIALVGPSGSGKTTLLHLISGLLTPTAGEIKFNDIVLSSMPETWRDTWRAKAVGYVFQKLNLLSSLTVLDNLLVAMSFANVIPKKDQRQWAIQLLDQVGVSDKLGKFPHQLSMGEQQRVAAARAVINKPSLILADEPTASLDQDNGLLVLDMLRQFAKESGSTLVVSTHDRQIINQFERICSLRKQPEEVIGSATSNRLA
ncbi:MULTISPECIES: ABC transporter ATP-binding protein [Pelosinus]|uniref:ABC transporter related protein n=1 Tax=Pelosinus fermentans B4 TaxID=1149862 RepID=I9LEK6_9FIRM|nr:MULTISPECIES: ABC transporter ATP-binding protein [Pelosinus]EIW18879.1 ABC transporter related protein [Pelosinus fermentans B4]EIW21911.1 ABC transporter related protein [Pelosinus fermentans A11]OAM95238.1 Phosphonate-transporting ATPase [Pelosinus fermentans DSM 17108]SDR25194.1 putative ABC transport system ATP-binding protein [Pelosinus fermentans]